MDRVRTQLVLSQDKELLQPPRNLRSLRDFFGSTRFHRCSRVARQRWPLFLALISVITAAFGIRLGVGLNVSRSAPRGIYRAVADAPAC